MSFAVLAADCLAPSFCNSDYDCLFTFSYMEVGCRSDSKRSSPQQCKGCISVVTASIIHCCIAGDCGDMVCVGSDPTTAYCQPGTLVGSACSATGDLLSVSCHAFIGTLKTHQAMQQGRCMGRIFSWVMSVLGCPGPLCQDMQQGKWHVCFSQK